MRYEDPCERGRGVMGRIILKASPDRDLYVEWSTIVEAPVFIGNRRDMAANLKRQHHESDLVNRRLARADERGTSAVGGYSFFGAWDDTGIIVEQRGVLIRDRLADFLAVYDEAAPEAAYALLLPFEED